MKAIKYYNILLLLLISGCMDVEHEYEVVYSNNPWYENGLSYIASDAVDLGLPSGIKWASYNVGASAPEEFGGYYAWCETETKSKYTWETYLGPEYDVANAKWGGSWRMPTSAEQQELIDECTWVWTTLNGIRGYKVTGPNGNSIFLPAAGYRSGYDVYYRGSRGYYWSGSLDSILSDDACYLYFNSSWYDCYDGHCYVGRTVRPVSE